MDEVFEVKVGDLVGRISREVARKMASGKGIDPTERRIWGITHEHGNVLFYFWRDRGTGVINLDSAIDGAIFDDDVYEILKKVREYIAYSNVDRFKTEHGTWTGDWEGQRLVYKNRSGAEYLCAVDKDDGKVDVDLEEFAKQYVFNADDLDAIQKLLVIALEKM